MNITYKDSEGKELKYFTQWDINRTLELDGIDNSSAMIHFYNRLSSRALVVQPKKQLEKYVVNVPNILLQEPCDIIVAVFVENGEEGKTEEIFSIPVEAKTKPEDYTFEENIDYINWVELNEQAKKQLEELQRLTKEIQDKYDSGAFKGDKGDRGSGIKSISKIATNGLKDTYRILFDDGKTYDYYITNGKTPVKGVDYYTIAEKEQLVNEVIEDSTNKFNTNVVEKTNTFNSNASQKLQDYNSNHTTKFKAYNDNADTRYDSYNSNADIKFNDFNSNATTKTSTYNTNATDKLNTYNKNAENKFNTYNDNATTKFNAYNTNDETKKTAYNNNAIDKLKEYNDNTTAKIEEYNTNATTKLDEFNTNASDYNKRITNNSKRIKTLETNIFDSGEAEGENLNINDTALAEFQQVDMQINKAQETTKGYQLFDINKTIKNDKNIYKFSEEEIRIVNLNEGKLYYKNIIENMNLPVGNYVLTIEKKGVFNGGNVLVYNADGVKFDEKSIAIRDKAIFNIRNNSFGYLQFFNIANDTDCKIKINLNLGETEKPYEPFTGGIASPNPNYQQPINTIKNNFEFTSCGKNLFDKEAIPYKRKSWIDETGKINGYELYNIYKIDLKEGNYTFTGSNLPINPSIVGYDENDNIIYAITRNKRSPLTLNLPKGTKYILISIIIASDGKFGEDERDFVQLEYGEQPTPYEPYKSITNTINLASNEFLPRR